MKNANLLFAVLAAAAVATAAVYYLSKPAVSYTAPPPPDNLSSGNLAFLVLGRAGQGEGGMWEQAPDLTDAIVLVDFNGQTGYLNLISIPRDLYGKWGNETFKINEAFERGKINDLLNGVAEITGVGTDKYIVIDLNTVRQAVDSLGGIDVNLPSAVTDKVSGYTLSAGEHHLDGATAVWLMRNRYAKDGDFFREANQHLVIEGILEKLRGLSSAQKLSFIVKVLPALSSDPSNINFGDLLNYSAVISRVKFNNIILNFGPGLLKSSSTPVGNGSMYTLIPAAGINNYGNIQSYILSELK